VRQVLSGFKKRCETLGAPLPEILVADNCCHIRNEVAKHLPNTDVSLDVYHFMMR